MEWGEFVKILVTFIGVTASIIAVFVSGYCLSKVESTKSKLKKTEMLFELRVAAVREFNEICQKYNPLNLGELFRGNIFGPQRWDEIRESISEYRARHEYVFESTEITMKLKEILSSLDYSADPRYIFPEVNGAHAEADAFKEDWYKKVLALMLEANAMIKKYLFEEAKR